MADGSDVELEFIKSRIRDIPDFPKKGILFKDICPLLQDPNALRAVTDLMTKHIKEKVRNVDVIAGLEARGFLFGPIVAMNLGVPFVPIRKKGKLPGETINVSYTKEYGEDIFEIQVDAIKSGHKVVIVDDLLATGGTMLAACELVTKVGGEVCECLCIIELDGLNGRDLLTKPFHTLLNL